MRVIGGLGNQMFQYAAGRALSLSKNTQLKLFTRDYTGYTLHSGFELDSIFKLNIQTVNDEELHAILGWRKYKLIRRILEKNLVSSLGLGFLRGNKLVVEPHFSWWSGFLNLPSDCYIVGYWQSEKYFQHVSEVIKDDFKFKNPLDGLNAELADEITARHSVSLHVRRGDYITNSKTAAVHGFCGVEYYQKAIDHIAKTVESPVFYVFSDDITWVKSNIKIDFPCTYITHNTGTDSYYDMQLMSYCQHNIIANSSFSWWGAWLNNNPKKIVVAPSQWFKVDKFDCSDLLPSDWVNL